MTLKPFEERKLTASQVIDRLRPKLNSVPGARGDLAGQSEFENRREAIATRNINTRCAPIASTTWCNGARSSLTK